MPAMPAKGPLPAIVGDDGRAVVMPPLPGVARTLRTVRPKPGVSGAYGGPPRGDTTATNSRIGVALPRPRGPRSCDMEPLTLDAGGVRLRPHTEADLDLIVDQCTDPESRTWTTVPDPYTREHAEQFLADIRRRWSTDVAFYFAIADAGSDEFLGTVDVSVDGAGQGELGFGLRAAARGRGAMSAALRAVARWAFDTDGLDLSVLHWRAFVGNWPSRRAVWAVGFRVEGVVRGLCAARGRRYDAWIGSLRRGDPLQPASPWYEPPTLVGRSCVLRPFANSDAIAIREALSDEQTRLWLGDVPEVFTASHVHAYLHRVRNEAASGTSLYVAAADPATDRCVGGFAIIDIEPEPGLAEVGYWVHPAARGAGLATEAVRLLARHAVIDRADGGLGLIRLGLRAAAGNTGSQRVAEKAGFTRVGVQRRMKRLGDGTIDDLVEYELLAEDLAPD